jgi:hypothetical protein
LGKRRCLPWWLASPFNRRPATQRPFTLEPGLAKKQVSGILSFGKIEKITEFAQQQVGFAHLINSEASKERQKKG